MGTNKRMRTIGRTPSRKPAPPDIEITNDQVVRPGNSGSTLGTPLTRDDGLAEEQANKALALRIARRGLPGRAPDRQPYMFTNPHTTMCYRNSALAMLLNIEPFLGWLRLYRQVSLAGTGDPPNSYPESIMSYLYKMAEAYWLSLDASQWYLDIALDEDILCAFWADINSRWQWGRSSSQEDASEFLDHLWTQARLEIAHDHDRAGDVLDAMVSTTKLPRDVTGPSCSHAKVRVRDWLPSNNQLGLFFNVIVNNASPRTLKACIQNALHDIAARGPCLICGKEPMPGHRFYKFRTLPEVLFFSISRYEVTPDVRQAGHPQSRVPPPSARVSHARCEVPDILDLREFRENEEHSRDQDAVYQYAAAVFHLGDSIKSGHYVTHVRNKDGRCFLLNDLATHRVRQCSMQEMNNNLSLDVTIVAYVKMHGETADEKLVPDAEERVLTWWRGPAQPTHPDQGILHQEPPEAGSPNTRTSRPGSTHTAASKPEPPISSSPKTGASKPDTPMPGSPKSGSPKTGTSRPELPRPEPPQHDTPKQGNPMQDPFEQDTSSWQATHGQATPRPDHSSMSMDELKKLMKLLGLALDRRTHPLEWYVDKAERHATNGTTYPEYTLVELKKEMVRRGLDPKSIKVKDVVVGLLQKDDTDKGYEGSSVAVINQGQMQGMPKTKRGRPPKRDKKPENKTIGKQGGSKDTTPTKQDDGGATPENLDLNPVVPPRNDPDRFTISATLQIIGKPSERRAEPLTHAWSLPAKFQPELNLNLMGELTVTAPESQKSQYPLPASDRQIFHIPSLNAADKKRKNPFGGGDGGDDDDDDGSDDNPRPPKRPTGESPPSPDRNEGSAQPPKKLENPQQDLPKDGPNDGKNDTISPLKDSSNEKTPNDASPSSDEIPGQVPSASPTTSTHLHSTGTTPTGSRHTSASDSELPPVMLGHTYDFSMEPGTGKASSGKNPQPGSKSTSCSDISSTVPYDAYHEHEGDYLLDPATGRPYDYLLDPGTVQPPSDTITGKDSQLGSNNSGSESDISSTVPFDAYNEHLGDYLLDPETGLPFAHLLEVDPTTPLFVGTDTDKASTSRGMSNSPPKPRSPPTPRSPNTSSFLSKSPNTPKTPFPPSKQLPSPPRSRPENEKEARVRKPPAGSRSPSRWARGTGVR